ncbi:MAG: hypothetical protein MJ217_01045 [Bacilli bacterium]|nr:hypothetical protein [Bacilli bacterium]
MIKKLLTLASISITSALSVCLAIGQNKMPTLVGADSSGIKTITFGTKLNPFPNGNGSGTCYSDDGSAEIVQTFATSENGTSNGVNQLELSNDTNEGLASFVWRINVHGIVRIDYDCEIESKSGSFNFSVRDPDYNQITYSHKNEPLLVNDSAQSACLVVSLFAERYSGVSVNSLKITYDESLCRQLINNQ